MKKPSREDILNGWLKYYDTTIEEIKTLHDEEILKSPDWFKLYPVTQEQHDEWVIWAKEYIKKTTKLSKKFVDKNWGFVYIDCAPNVIK